MLRNVIHYAPHTVLNAAINKSLSINGMIIIGTNQTVLTDFLINYLNAEWFGGEPTGDHSTKRIITCLLYTSDAADD